LLLLLLLQLQVFRRHPDPVRGRTPVLAFAFAFFGLSSRRDLQLLSQSQLRSS
jgi:hypothetical protein